MINGVSIGPGHMVYGIGTRQVDLYVNVMVFHLTTPILHTRCYRCARHVIFSN